MLAIRIHQHGGPEALSLDEVERPVPGEGEVLIQVVAAGVNRRDLWIRQGRPDTRIQLPYTPGMDVAGVVVETGPGVPRDRIGERVVLAPGIGCGHCRRCLEGEEHLCGQFKSVGSSLSGGYAQYVAAPAANALVVPEGLTLQEAGAMPVTYTTAWRSVARLGRVRAGENVLVHAVGSGAGHAAFQVARLLGARVIVTAGDDWKLERALKEGAAGAVNYTRNDLVAEVMRLTDGAGVDLVVEHIGGETFRQSLESVCRGGRVVSFGATTGAEIEINLLALQKRRAQIIASAMGSRADLLHALTAAGKGLLRPALAAQLPLREAREAHRLLESRQVYGKIVLLPQS